MGHLHDRSFRKRIAGPELAALKRLFEGMAMAAAGHGDDWPQSEVVITSSSSALVRQLPVHNLGKGWKGGTAPTPPCRRRRVADCTSDVIQRFSFGY